ncbi:MAG: heme exporter protein CcmD [Magnetococcales bacterium]|nr:heme exporter protein CcmD [Magnetococcales bacterium]
MNEYTEYVWAVYGLAGGLFGGLTLLWWSRLRRLQSRLQAEGRRDS